MDTKALREKILDLAIRGKLVPQNPEDEPASVLLERIRAEKQQMVRDGKLKAKDLKKDTVIFRGDDNLHYEKFADGTVKCIEDEIPFEVPEGWVWCRLGTISSIVTGRLDANAQIVNGQYPFFTCGEEVLLTDSYAFDCNAILLGGNNATGNFKMHRYNGKFNAYQRVYVITSYIELNVDYLYIGIQTHLPSLQKLSIGSQTRYLKLGMVQNLLIPLPPLCEQKCITEIFFGYIEQVEQIESNKLCLAQLINSTKSKILDLAIHGKLVPQNPDDEPASVLLERIRTEKEELIKQGKIKRDKKESVIYRGDDNSYYLSGNKVPLEMPFKIPDSWVWSTLYEICNYGETTNITADEIPDSAWILDLEDIEKDSGKILQKVTNKIRKTTSTKHQFQSGMVLYSKLRPYLNKVVVAAESGYCTSEILPLHFAKDVQPEYAQIFLMSPYFVEYANNCSYGMKMPRLGTKDGQKAFFPVPPHNEQIKIVKFVKDAIAYIDSIYDSL